MSTVKEIFEYLKRLAPLELAEDYDNPGLLAGDPDCEVTAALLSLDITSNTAQEAAKSGAQLVISHHPVIFKPIRSVLSTGGSAPVWSLVRHSLSAICMHTNLDWANGGVNDALAAALGLTCVTGLCGCRGNHYKKITVFVPQDHAEKVRLAMAGAGAGKLGDYDGCAFEVKGSGYFRPLDGAKPFIGQRGVPERVDELRIEAVCEPGRVDSVVAAMKKAHPYEVPAFDIFDDEALCEEVYIGRVGEIASAPLVHFAQYVKRCLSSACVKIVDAGKQSQKIAVCGGAVDEEIILKVAKTGADTLVTGEMKHNLYYTALEAGINVIEAGHFATETVILPVLRAKLSAAFPQVRFDLAQTNKEPYTSI